MVEIPSPTFHNKMACSVNWSWFRRLSGRGDLKTGCGKLTSHWNYPIHPLYHWPVSATFSCIAINVMSDPAYHALNIWVKDGQPFVKCVLFMYSGKIKLYILWYCFQKRESFSLPIHMHACVRVHAQSQAHKRTCSAYVTYQHIHKLPADQRSGSLNLS